MPYGFPNVDINFQVSEAKDNAGNSGSTWCKSRQEAKGNQLANNILWKWGFSRTDQTLYYYKCANLSNGFGLWNNATNYKGKGSAVSAADARETANCEVLEGAVLMIESEYQRAVRRLNAAGGLGGASAKNAKIDKYKWSRVRDYFSRVTLYQDGVNYNTCLEEASIASWEAILAAQQAALDKRPEGISNTALGSIIGVGALGMILVVTKFVK